MLPCTCSSEARSADRTAKHVRHLARQEAFLTRSLSWTGRAGPEMDGSGGGDTPLWPARTGFPLSPMPERAQRATVRTVPRGSAVRLLVGTVSVEWLVRAGAHQDSIEGDGMSAGDRTHSGRIACVLAGLVTATVVMVLVSSGPVGAVQHSADWPGNESRSLTLPERPGITGVQAGSRRRPSTGFLVLRRPRPIRSPGTWPRFRARRKVRADLHGRCDVHQLRHHRS
jgi:hypothetical protein